MKLSRIMIFLAVAALTIPALAQTRDDYDYSYQGQGNQDWRSQNWQNEPARTRWQDQDQPGWQQPGQNPTRWQDQPDWQRQQSGQNQPDWQSGQNQPSWQSQPGWGQGPSQYGSQPGSMQSPPPGWVRVGVDFNNDGMIDQWQIVQQREMQQVFNRSQRELQRMQRQAAGPQGQGFGYGQQGYQPYGPAYGYYGSQGQIPQQIQLSGKITDLRTASFAGETQPHQLAKVQSNQGRTYRIDLGPQQQLANLNLANNTQINVNGVLGSINNQMAVIATQVRAGSQNVTVQRTPTGMKDFQGDIQSTQNVNAGGKNHLLAQVRLQNGPTAVVDFGPQQNLRDLNLQNGQQVNFLAHDVMVGGRHVLLAHQVRANNRDATITWMDPLIRQQMGSMSDTAQQGMSSPGFSSDSQQFQSERDRERQRQERQEREND